VGVLSALGTGGAIATQALAVNSSAFERLLAELPATADGAEMENFVSRHGDLEQYLQARVRGGAYRASVVNEPVIQQRQSVKPVLVENGPLQSPGHSATSEVVLDIRAFGGSVRLLDRTGVGIADRVAALMPADTIARRDGRPEITLHATGGDGDLVTVSGYGYDPVGPVRSEEAVMWLRAAIDAGVACTATDALFVHAGVVGWRNHAIVIPGRSGTGKSSLTMALVDAGATYYSDDLAPIGANGYVHAYAKAPSLKGSVLATRQVQPPAEAGAAPPLPIALIISTSFVPESRWVPLTQRGATGVLPLLKNAVIATGQPEAAVAVAAAVGASSVTLAGPRPEAAAVAELILKTLDGLLEGAAAGATAA
jgi:hypothetical protein